MATRDLVHNENPVISVAPVALAAGATNGAGVDTSGFESVAIHAASGAQGGTSPVLKLSVQDSPDNTTWTNVADALIEVPTGVVGPNSAGFTVAASSVVKVGYIGAQRYVRAVYTLSGTTPTATAGANVILGKPRNLPA